MANQNFKVKKGLEVGTGVTISDGNINISGIITAQFKGDGSALTGVTAAGSGVVVQEEGSNVGTAATINFIGSSVTAALSGGIANVTVTGGGDVVSDTTPQLGGNLDLNSKDITGTGNISITGGFNATGVSTFQENVVFQSTASFGDNDKINVGASNDLQIFHDGTSNIISDAVGAGISLVGNTKVVGVLTATSFSGSLATTDLTGTITNAQLAGSITDGKLSSTFLKNVVEDTTPQLGGNLDVNSKDITGTGNVTLTGVVTATSFSGSGVGLTSIPAGQLTGTVADARLSTVTSSKLSGALPALDGSALTGLTGASAGTYGASTNTPIITVDSNGRITGIATVATSGAGGGGGISNIIEDTTPQLGGNLDLNSKSITGTGNIDITGYAGVSGVSTFSGSVGFATHIHDAGTGGLDIRTNLLRIKNDADSETLATFAEDGAVSFYHDNALRLATTNTGVSITDNLNVAGVSTFTGLMDINGDMNIDGSQIAYSASSNQLKFSDNTQLRFGGGNDLRIYHNGTNSFIENTTGELLIRAKISENSINCNPDGSVELYHDNSKKLETTSSGVTVTGTLAATAVTGDGSGLTNLPAPGISTASSNVQVNFDVTANGSGAYRFTGPGNDAADDNPDLYLIRGQRYRFTNNSGGSHPFQIRSSPGGSAYSTGVTNNGGASGNIDFNVQHDAPARLYYQCTSHSAMVGNIYITGGANWQTTSVNTSTAEEIFTLNKVGIGTNNPQEKLHVLGTSDFIVDTDATGLRFGSYGEYDIALVTGRNTSSGSSRLYIENGDGEALRITSGGRILKGLTTARDNLANNASGVSAEFQIEGTSFTTSTLSVIRNSNDANDGGIILGKTRASSTGGNTVVQAGDDLGNLTFAGSDGTSLQFGAEILAEVQSGVGNDDMPTDLIFKTNGGTTSTAERLRITSAGLVGIGEDNPLSNLHINSDSNTTLSVYSEQTTGGNYQVASMLLRTYESSSNTESVGDFLLTGKNTVTFGGANRFVMRGQTNVELAFYSNNAERMTIDTSGNAILKSANAAFKAENPNSSGDYLRMYAGSGTSQWDIYTNGELLRMGDNSSSATAKVQFDNPTLHRSTSVTPGVAAVTAKQEVNNGGYLIFDGKNSSDTTVFSVTHNGRVKVTDGIDFSSNANAAGMTSELLDDYEEGTWTPGLTIGGVVPTYSIQTGSYVKIGRLVVCYGMITLTNRGSGTGGTVITGLPFTVVDILSSTSLEGGGLFTYQSAVTGIYGPMTILPAQSSTTASVYAATSSGGQMGGVQQSNLYNTFDSRFTFSYQTAS